MFPALPLLDPGPLIDGTLQLVVPQQRYIHELLVGARDVQTRRQAVELSMVTRKGLKDFLSLAPGGRMAGDPDRQQVPTLHYWMKLSPPRPFGIAGAIALRIDDTDDTSRYVGHFGYHVYPKARGQHLAERSCRLLLPIAKLAGLDELWITCNPENAGSRRTCQRLGAEMIEIVPVPMNHPLYARGDTAKCRYRLMIG